MGVDPDTVPGQSQETLELSIDVGDLPIWMDTTYVGFAVPLTSGIQLVASDSSVTSRLLGRFPTLPDSIFVDSARVRIDSMVSARFRIVVDSLSGSVLPESGTELRIHALGRGFDERDVTWSEARPGEPWSTPGGDLGELLGSLVLDSLQGNSGQDTLFLPLIVDTDSLLSAWRAADGEPGYVLSTVVDGTTLIIKSLALVFDVRPEGQDTLIEVVRAPVPSTFIFDPTTPAPTNALRIGGLPAARMYIRFALPETLDGVPLRGSRINRASLILRSLGTPPAPFATTNTGFASVFNLLADPFELGEKTPIGVIFGSFIELEPENLAAGGEQEINITALIQIWAGSSPDSVPELHLGIRALPEGESITFWEFGDGNDPANAPRLELLVTPPTRFDVP
ncbi:MAG: hypothetical protein E4H28_08380 [Gemmatimonadales bacterium]|nr:MAG: hypothetical protein E4H28_08380 [Gemmatimonadales bacterium]